MLQMQQLRWCVHGNAANEHARRNGLGFAYKAEVVRLVRGGHGALPRDMAAVRERCILRGQRLCHG